MHEWNDDHHNAWKAVGTLWVSTMLHMCQFLWIVWLALQCRCSPSTAALVWCCRTMGKQGIPPFLWHNQGICDYYQCASHWKQLKDLEQGCTIEGVEVKPVGIAVEMSDPSKRNKLQIVLAEGKNREVNTRQPVVCNAALVHVKLSSKSLTGLYCSPLAWMAGSSAAKFINLVWVALATGTAAGQSCRPGSDISQAGKSCSLVQTPPILSARETRCPRCIGVHVATKHITCTHLGSKSIAWFHELCTFDSGRFFASMQVRVGGYRMPKELGIGQFQELKPHEVRRVTDTGAQSNPYL